MRFGIYLALLGIFELGLGTGANNRVVVALGGGMVLVGGLLVLVHTVATGNRR